MVTVTPCFAPMMGLLYTGVLSVLERETTGAPWRMAAAIDSLTLTSLLPVVKYERVGEEACDSPIAAGVA